MNKKSSKRSYAQKLAVTATSLTALHVIPAVTQAGVVHGVGPLSNAIPDRGFSGSFDHNGNPVPLDTTTSTIDWDIDGDGSSDFSLNAVRHYSVYSAATSSGGTLTSTFASSVFMSLQPQAGQNGLVTKGSTGFGPLKAMSLGDIVGDTVGSDPATNDSFTPSRRFIFSTYNGDANLILDPDTTNYIGFKFEGDAGEVLFGWAEVNIDFAALKVSIDQWAYKNNFPE